MKLRNTGTLVEPSNLHDTPVFQEPVFAQTPWYF